MSKELQNKVEALLFASGKPISVEDLVRLTESNTASVKKALESLRKDFEGRPLMIVEEKDSWKMTVREPFLPLVRKIVADTELSKATLETLAVIAWKSPVRQSEVIEIRGNKGYEHIKELEELGFLKKEKYGRTYLVKLSEKFFEYFDIEGDKGIKDILKSVRLADGQKKITEAFDKKKLGGLEVYDEEKAPEEPKELPKEEGEKLGMLEVVDERPQEEAESEKPVAPEQIEEEEPSEEQPQEEAEEAPTKEQPEEQPEEETPEEQPQEVPEEQPEEETPEEEPPDEKKPEVGPKRKLDPALKDLM